METIRVYLEQHYCAYLVTLLDGKAEPDCLIQSDWDYPSLAMDLGCHWRLCDCKDPSRAIQAACKWLDSNLGELELPACSAIVDYFPEAEEDLLEACFDRFSLQLTREEAEACSHQGDCYADCEAALRNSDGLRGRLEAIPAEELLEELAEYGAWSREELREEWEEEPDNVLIKLLWIAAGNIREELREGRQRDNFWRDEPAIEAGNV